MAACITRCSNPHTTEFASKAVYEGIESSDVIRKEGSNEFSVEAFALAG